SYQDVLGGIWGHGQGRAKRARRVALTMVPIPPYSHSGGRSGPSTQSHFTHKSCYRAINGHVHAPTTSAHDAPAVGPPCVRHPRQIGHRRSVEIARVGYVLRRNQHKLAPATVWLASCTSG